MDVFSLQNKNIVITGASSGIGRECAIQCSVQGANVVLIGRNVEQLEVTISMLTGKNHIFIEKDISNFDDNSKVIKEIVSKLGKIDGFIHSAGIEMTIPLKVLKPNNYLDVFSINVIGGFDLAKTISKKKFVNDGASYIFISSVMSIVGQTGKIAYSASKGALVAGAKSMALELSSKNIRVNSVSPGLVKTNMSNELLDSLPEESRNNIEEMHPLGFGMPEDIANTCVFLLSDASKWITGTNLVIDGGYSAK